jgi:hypothetical protein
VFAETLILYSPRPQVMVVHSRICKEIRISAGGKQMIATDFDVELGIRPRGLP